MHEGGKLTADALLVVRAEAAQVEERDDPHDGQAGPIGEDERAVGLDRKAARPRGQWKRASDARRFRDAGARRR